MFFFRPAGGTGDPHFVTLDGLNYSFNGFGEFVLLQAEELDFEIQVMIRRRDKETERDR